MISKLGLLPPTWLLNVTSAAKIYDRPLLVAPSANDIGSPEPVSTNKAVLAGTGSSITIESASTAPMPRFTKVIVYSTIAHGMDFGLEVPLIASDSVMATFETSSIGR